MPNGQFTIHNPLTRSPRQPLLARRRRTALLGVAAAAVLAGVLVVVLTAGGHRSPGRRAGASAGGPTVVQLAAGYLHVPPAQIRQLMAKGQTLSQIAAAKGSSRAALLEALYARKARQIKSLHLTPQRERTELAATRAALAERLTRRRVSSLSVAAAKYLGLSRTELRAKLASGDTLSSLAEATGGHSRRGLIDAMTRERRETIEQAEKRHVLNPAVARRRIARLRKRAERLADAHPSAG